MIYIDIYIDFIVVFFIKNVSRNICLTIQYIFNANYYDYYYYILPTFNKKKQKIRSSFKCINRII